ncbi:MAG: IS256 family transposase [Atopobiaceae bacterium]|nr:IS256 family transposase [Atopobiaceae bacterium]
MSNPIVSFDEEAVKSELRELVRKTIEETINAMLDEEADQLVGAGPYERTDERAAYRAGHYERGFTTTSGQVTIKMPKLKGMRFATAVVERYKRRETSVEEAIIETCLAGVSTRRIEDVSEILWGAGVSAGTVSNPDEKAYKSVEEWHGRPLAGEYPYVSVDGIYLKRSWGGSYENVSILVAIGVDGDGRREIIGCAEGFTESKDSWREFLLWLRGRGLKGVRMVTGDKCQGMAGALEEAFPQARYQRCTVHFYRSVFSEVPKQRRTLVAKMPRAVHAQESKEAAVAKAGEVAAGLEGMRLGAAAKVVREGCLETPAHADFPMQHWTRIRTNNAIERLNRGIRRRTRVVGTFPDGRSALMLVTARLKYIAEREWGKRRHLDVSLLGNEEVGA